MDFTLVALISYVFGSIPFGFLLTKIFLKKDIRKIGSGNIGATNALRTGNKLIAYSTLILDILKAFNYFIDICKTWNNSFIIKHHLKLNIIFVVCFEIN